MIVKFLFSNYRSFLGTTTLSFEPVSKTQQHADHLIQVPGRSEKLLKLALIYGPNGSGKTNLIKSLNFLINLVLGREIVSSLPQSRLGGEGEPSNLILEFVTPDTVTTKPWRYYRYSISLKGERILKEELLDLSKREKLVYSILLKDDGTRILEQGTQVKKKKFNTVFEVLPTSKLFLNECFDREIEELKPVIEWFKNHVNVRFPNTSIELFENQLLIDSQFLDIFKNYLVKADPGITDVKLVPLSEEEMQRDSIFKRAEEDFLRHPGKPKYHFIVQFTPSGIHDRFLMIRQDGKTIIYRMQTWHQGPSGPVCFNLNDESSGLQYFLEIINPLWRAIQQKNTPFVWVADELDRGLHPCLLEYIVKEFLGKSVLSQAIFSLHQPHLIDLNLLRKDEIWIAEKNSFGMSSIYSFADFELRGDARNIDKDYLHGVFGGVPPMFPRD